MAVSYRVENQAGERVGVENHPGSDYSGRQCRPLKDVAGDVTERDDCGLVLNSIVREGVKICRVALVQGEICGL